MHLLDEMLRARFVCGVNNAAIQRKLLSVKDLTFVKAREISIAMETAAKQTEKLTLAGNFESINKVEQYKRGNCYRCGESKHSETDCPFKEKECFFCRKTGHISRICRLKKNTKGRGKEVAPTRTLSSEATNTLLAAIDNMHIETKSENESMYNLYKCDVQLPGNSVKVGNSGEMENVGGGEYLVHRCAVQREEPIYVEVEMNKRTV